MIRNSSCTLRAVKGFQAGRRTSSDCQSRRAAPQQGNGPDGRDHQTVSLGGLLRSTENRLDGREISREVPQEMAAADQVGWQPGIGGCCENGTTWTDLIQIYGE